MKRSIGRQPPFDPAPSPVVGRKRDLLLPHPHEYLANGLQFREPREDKSDCFLHPAIGVPLDTVVISFRIAHRHSEKELSPPSFLLLRLNRALPEHRQLHLAHRSFHTEQKPVIGRTGIIDSIL